MSYLNCFFSSIDNTPVSQVPEHNCYEPIIATLVEWEGGNTAQKVAAFVMKYVVAGLLFSSVLGWSMLISLHEEYVHQKLDGRAVPLHPLPAPVVDLGLAAAGPAVPDQRDARIETLTAELQAAKEESSIYQKSAESITQRNQQERQTELNQLYLRHEAALAQAGEIATSTKTALSVEQARNADLFAQLGKIQKEFTEFRASRAQQDTQHQQLQREFAQLKTDYAQLQQHPAATTPTARLALGDRDWGFVTSPEVPVVGSPKTSPDTAGPGAQSNGIDSNSSGSGAHASKMLSLTPLATDQNLDGLRKENALLHRDVEGLHQSLKRLTEGVQDILENSEDNTKKLSALRSLFLQSDIGDAIGDLPPKTPRSQAKSLESARKLALWSAQKKQTPGAASPAPMTPVSDEQNYREKITDRNEMIAYLETLIPPIQAAIHDGQLMIQEITEFANTLSLKKEHKLFPALKSWAEALPSDPETSALSTFDGIPLSSEQVSEEEDVAQPEQAEELTELESLRQDYEQLEAQLEAKNGFHEKLCGMVRAVVALIPHVFEMIEKEIGEELSAQFYEHFENLSSLFKNLDIKDLFVTLDQSFTKELPRFNGTLPRRRGEPGAQKPAVAKQLRFTHDTSDKKQNTVS